jgi:hypothetical protein
LFWYVRNALYFEMGLHQRPDTILFNYDEYLAGPERVAIALCGFLALPYRKAMIANIDPRRPSQRPPLAIDPRIRGRCNAMKERLDAACSAQMAQLRGERTAPRPASQRPATVAAHP